MGTMRAGLIGLAAMSLGCGAGRTSPPTPAPRPGAGTAAAADSDRTTTRVEIDNQNFSDMNVYLIDAGTPVFLGSASGLSRATLSIPAGAGRSGSEIRLLAEPIGGSSPIRTPKLLLGPGQSVYWTIGADPASSFASVG